MDRVGAHNLFYVCDGPYGAGRIIRQSSPHVMATLSALVTASGGVDVDRDGSAAWFDLGLVENRDKRHNGSPHPGTPGNFTCEGDGGGPSPGGGSSGPGSGGPPDDRGNNGNNGCGGPPPGKGPGGPPWGR